jgi:hypothetical protein
MFTTALILVMQHDRKIDDCIFSPQIGQLKCGLNRPSWDKLIFDPTYLGLTMKTGLVTGIISLTVCKSWIILFMTSHCIKKIKGQKYYSWTVQIRMN